MAENLPENPVHPLALGVSIGGRPIAELASRLWAKVEVSGECWNWTASTTNGYGKLAFKILGTRRNVNIKAHRLSWILAHGPIPKGVCVLHHCDNRLCVRPAHLFLGTHADNADDASKKGRLRLGKRVWGERHGNAKLTDDGVRELRRLAARGWTFAQLGDHFSVSPATAHRVATKQSWRHVA